MGVSVPRLMGKLTPHTTSKSFLAWGLLPEFVVFAAFLLEESLLSFSPIAMLVAER